MTRLIPRLAVVLAAVASVALVLPARGLAQSSNHAPKHDNALDTRGDARNLQELIRESDVVVLGTVRSKTVQTVTDVMGAAHTFDVDVEDVFKGDARQGVTLLVPRSATLFSDADRRYVLMLHRTPMAGVESVRADRGIYSPTSQGIFCIDGESVLSMARPSDPIWKAFNGTPAPRFVEMVREAAAASRSH